MCQTVANLEQERRQWRIVSSSFWQNGQVGETLTSLYTKTDLVEIEKWQVCQIKNCMLAATDNFQIQFQDSWEDSISRWERSQW